MEHIYSRLVKGVNPHGTLLFKEITITPKYFQYFNTFKLLMTQITINNFQLHHH
jgi:hypothetical protein